MSAHESQRIDDHWFHTYRQWDARDAIARTERDHTMLKASYATADQSANAMGKARRALWADYREGALRAIAECWAPAPVRAHWRSRLEGIMLDDPTARAELDRLLEDVEACGSAEDPGEEMDRRFQRATGAPAGWFARLLATPRPPSALEEHIRERQRKKLWAIAFHVRMLLNI